MDWLHWLNEAMAYIEEHLCDEIETERLVQIARCSSYHFQRMFSYLADVTLSEYIRRRRMTLAAVDLQRGAKVIDVALKYGYDSPTSFNRAFQSVHGVSPSEARKSGVVLKAFPPISFKLTIKGEAEMNYRIEKRGPIRIVGVKEQYTGGSDESYAKVPLFWRRANAEGITQKLCSIMNRDPCGIMGVCTWATKQELDYYIAVSSDSEVPEGMHEFTIPECTWAIFECVGPMPEAIQNLYKRIISEWLPSSGYVYANAPDIELYFDGDTASEDYRCEVWLPVAKK